MTRGRYVKPKRGLDENPKMFDLSDIFPEVEGIPKGPFPKQRLVYETIRSGRCQGGGFVYQGGKGCAKTICGAAAVFMVHHRPEWRGLTSVIARESYPALMTGTWDEFKKMLDKIPARLLKSVREPSTNSMGFIEWEYGGTTMFLSLSDERTWASANVGFAWVDEGHLQDGNIVGKLTERIRQANSPRCALITTNPAGRNYSWDGADRRQPVIY